MRLSPDPFPCFEGGWVRLRQTMGCMVHIEKKKKKRVKRILFVHVCIYLRAVPHQPSSGNLVMVKNLTQLSQLTIGIFKAKKLFLAKKGQLVYAPAVVCMHTTITQNAHAPEVHSLFLLSHAMAPFA